MTARTLALVLAAAAALAPAAWGQAAPYVPPLIQTMDDRPADRLYRVDARRLALRPRPIATFRIAGDVAFSPDRRLMAHASGRRERIHVIDVARWRSLGITGLGRRGSLTLSWPREDRIVAVSGYAGRRALVFDVPSREVVARHRFRGRRLEGLEIPGGYALLLARRAGIGPTRLLIVDADGGLRTIELERIEGGYDAGGRRARFLRPDITVDPDAGRLYAISANRPLVAVVDTASGAVTHHRITREPGTESRLLAQAAKGNVDQLWRDVAWLGDGRIAVTGERHRAHAGGGGCRPHPSRSESG